MYDLGYADPRHPAEPVEVRVGVDGRFRLGFLRGQELRWRLLVLEARLLEHDAVEEAHGCLLSWAAPSFFLWSCYRLPRLRFMVL